MADVSTTVEVGVSEKGVAQATRDLTNFADAAGKAASGATNASRQMDVVSATAQRISKQLNTLNAIVSGYGAWKIFSYAAKTIGDFEQSMASVRAITRATGGEFAALREEAQRLGATTRYTASDAAEGMKLLAQAGYSTKEILTATKDVLSLAQAGAITLAQAAGYASKILHEFNLQVEETGRVADVLAKSANLANTNVSELGTAMAYVGPISATMNVSMEETAAALDVLANSGLSASMGGTALRGIMMRLANPTEKAAKALAAAGLSAEDYNIKARGLIPVLKTLSEANLGDSTKFTVFGARAAAGFSALASNIKSLKEFNSALIDSAGYAQETAKIMDDNVVGAWKNLVSAIEDFIIRTPESIGLITLVKEGMFGLANAIRFVTSTGFSGWFAAIAGGLGSYVAYIKLAAVASTGLGKNLTGIIATATRATKIFGTASVATNIFALSVRGLSAAFVTLMANPVTWIVAAGAALAGIAVHAYNAQKKVNDLAEEWDKTRQKMREQAATAEDRLKVQIENTIKNQVDALNKAKEEFSKMLAEDNSFYLFGGVRNDYKERTSWFGGVSEDVSEANEKILEFKKIYDDLLKTLRDENIGNKEKLNAFISFGDNLALLEVIYPQYAAMVKRMKAEVQKLQQEFQKLTEVTSVWDGLLEKTLPNTKKFIASLGGVAAADMSDLVAMEEIVDNLSNAQSILLEKAKAKGEGPVELFKASVSYLKEYTKGLDEAKNQMKELEKATADEALAQVKAAMQKAEAEYQVIQALVLEKALTWSIEQADAAALQSAEDRYNTFKKLYEQYSKWVADVKAGKGDTGKGKGNKTNDQMMRYREQVTTKIRDLEIQLNKLGYEQIGIETSELKVLDLQQKKVNELAKIREQAARVGIKDTDEQLKKAEELNNKLYDQKIRWQETIGPIEQAKSIADALGDSGASASADYELLLAKMASLNDEYNKQIAAMQKLDALGVLTEKQSEEYQKLKKQVDGTRAAQEQLGAQLFANAMTSRFAEGEQRKNYLTNQNIIDKQIASIEKLNALESQRKSIYDETRGKINELKGSLIAYAEAVSNGSIATDYGRAKMFELEIQTAKTQQVLGNTTWKDNLLLALDGVMSGFQGISVGVSDMLSSAFSSFTDGLADAFGRAIVYSENLQEAIGNLIKQITVGLISAIIKLMIQWAIMQAFGSSLSKTAQAEAIASAAATASTIAAAWSAAAAAVSLATFGANSVPAIAGMTAAHASSMALSMRPFKEGGFTGNVGKDTIAGVVHGGEYVMDARTVDRYGVGFFDALRIGDYSTPPSSAPMLAGAGSMGGTFIVNVFNNASDNVQVSTQTSMDSNGMPQLDVIVDLVEQKMSNRMYAGNSMLGNAIDKTRGTSRDRSLYR